MPEDTETVVGMTKKSAWMIKNSFDTDWSENGLGWIKYKSDNIGQFAAWIATDPKEGERLIVRNQ
jgi:C1A family cysteine protease